MTQVFTTIVFVSLIGVHSAGEPSPVVEMIPSIEVSGTGELKVVPDEIVLLFGIETQDMSLDKAKAENDSRTRRILSLVKELRIDPKDVQTDYVKISPEYEREDSKTVFKGYEVSVSIQVLLHDTTRYDELVTKALSAGANRLYSVDFRSSEARKHREEARRLALIAARKKAERMAAALDCRIGKPLSIVENHQSSLLFGSGQFISNTAQATEEEPSGNSDSDQSTLALGRISVKATVSVRFELIDNRAGRDDQ
ncbi:MAG: SIMPL domain-containing protein [Planctomycetes bacterium]|nr:SIMPL domain-containing protein [Planctomycetota bacterium]